MDGSQATASGKGRPEPGGGADLAIIRDQTQETLELVRSLVALLLQRQGDDGRPRLEELIAALVAQQRTILATVRQIQADLDALHDKLDRPDSTTGNGRDRADGGLRS